MAKIIDGKQIAEEIRNELKFKIDEWVREGHRPPQLTAVLIGSDPASCTYVKNKMKVSCKLQGTISHLFQTINVCCLARPVTADKKRHITFL